MGNCTCSCKRCHLLCLQEEEEWIHNPIKAYKSIYEYHCSAMKELRLNKGDILEVIGETQHWLYVRRHTVKDKRNGTIKEEGYVPRNYVKPVTSLEANLWYFENIKTRIEAKRCLLRPENCEGAFLVWRSSENNKFYLSVKNESHARHYMIKEQETDQQFYLVRHKPFQSLAELVQSYSTHQDGLCTQLSHPCVMLDVPSLPSLSVDAHWEVDRRQLTKVKKLGSGEFAEVWQGVWNNKIDVAIKEFRAISPEIYTEIKIMKELNHERLLKLYGVCTVSEPFCIITELMKNGSLKKYLINHSEKKDIEFSLMMNFAVQITEGMAYLEDRKIVHRDLRADNILLTDMQSCKIADFGLAQFTFPGVQKISSVKVPVKWMAPEIFDGREYTSKCDVWAFGILLTEIITFGNDPYPDQDKTACIQAIQRGERMEQPPDCPSALYDIMLLCWISKPEGRPCFTDLRYKLLALVLEPDLELSEGLSEEIN